MFGYEDPGHFFIVYAAELGITDNNNYNVSASWRVTKVASETAASTDAMMTAIFSGEDVPGQTQVLLRPSDQGWLAGNTYSWSLIYRPTDNFLNLEMFENTEMLWSHQWKSDFPSTYNLGKIGVFAQSQPARFFNLNVTSLCL